MTKAAKTSNGYAVKRKARIEHECRDCGRLILPNEEYYQVSVDTEDWEWYPHSYISFAVCEDCWRGKHLEVSLKR